MLGLTASFPLHVSAPSQEDVPSPPGNTYYTRSTSNIRLVTGISKPEVPSERTVLKSPAMFDPASLAFGAALPQEPLGAPATLGFSLAGVALRVTVANRPLTVS